MIRIKNKSSIQKMRHAGHQLSDIFETLGAVVKADTSTLEIDQWIEGQLRQKQLISKMKGYMGYGHVSCISVNDEVVHGIPCAGTILQPGDLVKVDVCAAWHDYCADMARVFFIPPVSAKVKMFADAAYQALVAGSKYMCEGNRLSDVSAAIQSVVEKNGYGVVRDFAGHGIGKQMHEDPEILNYGVPGQGPLLRIGMVFAIEPMITMGTYNVSIDDDGWTVRTADGQLAAHVEDTIAITQDGPEVLTRLNGFI